MGQSTSQVKSSVLFPDVKDISVVERGRLASIQDVLTNKRLPTLSLILPRLLSLRGHPFSIKDHFPFEPLFTTRLPKNIVLCTGRQLGKSMSIAAKGVVQVASIPYFRLLYVTPLYEQILRFSNDYIRPFLEDSPIRNILRTDKSSGSVLRRAFQNRSLMYFSYAYLSAERMRGISADCLSIDEAQDLDAAHLPIIMETISASKDFEIAQYTGTSKTKDGLLQSLWEKSSQAEWIIRCSACNFDNIPAAGMDGGHVEKMIGPYREDISEDKPGVVCAKCGHCLHPRTGRWYHRYPDRAADFVGYHIPQVILPIHYAKPDKWRKLLGKQAGASNFTTAKFYNEVLGIAYDLSTKLVNKTDLERAACLHPNIEEVAIRESSAYSRKVLAIDWGGGGEKGVSLTTLAVLGFLPDGRIDVIFGKRLLTPHAHVEEARECLRVFGAFRCDFLAHDYTGAGDLRQTVMVHSGLPLDRIVPVSYVPPTNRPVFDYHEPGKINPVGYYKADKTRTLQLTCYSIKFCKVRFFAYDYKNPDEPGLLHDFLSLVENNVPRKHASSLYLIQTAPSSTDDFAQAVNIGCCALWHMNDAWPTFSVIEQSSIGPGQVADSYEDWSNPAEEMLDGYFDRMD